MCTVTHVEEERKELEKEFHMLYPFGFFIMLILDSGVTVQNGSKFSLLVKDKEKQYSDTIFLHLKGVVHQLRVEVLSQKGDSVLRFYGRLCVPVAVS